MSKIQLRERYVKPVEKVNGKKKPQSIDQDASIEYEPFNGVSGVLWPLD